jgi:16S rRNA (cytidine1402-2'-O)-methyltransferase
VHGGEKQKLECALYVVATPMGNLRDITLRALDVLGAADVIAAEDTRNTIHLLNHYKIVPQRLLALHQHNEIAGAEKIRLLLEQGLSVAVVTDAGTPAISDPGALLVDVIRAAGQRVIPVPGVNAAVAALSVSGLVETQFHFYGFLPNKSSHRRRALQALKTCPGILVFYEAPHRVLECVADICLELGGECEIVIARELTKLHEQIHRCLLSQAAEWLNANAHHQKGEFVLLVRRNGLNDAQQEADDRATAILHLLLKELPLKQAARLAAEISGGSKNKLYAHALRVKDGD